MASKRPTPKPAVKAASPDDLLTTAETAGMFGGDTTKRTLEDWRRRNFGPDYIAFGARMVRYRRSVVEAYIKACEVQTSKKAA